MAGPVTQQFESSSFRPGFKTTTLPGILAGDISAAAISATLIAPVITAIDRAVVEHAGSSTRPLHTALKTHILCSFRHPRLFFTAKPFFYVWTLYAATYSTANGVESLGRAYTQNTNQVLVTSLTFLSTCLVNVPLGVWKDVRFVQIFGHGRTPPNSALDTPTTKLGAATAPHATLHHHPTAKFPKTVAATFLLRDALTIAGSFTLPQMLSHSIPETLLSDPVARMAAMQLVVPVLSQVVATPVHLLGLDLYSHQHRRERGERMCRIRSNLGAATLVRCARVIPAFGVGGVANAGLRRLFHRKAGVMG